MSSASDRLCEYLRQEPCRAASGVLDLLAAGDAGDCGCVYCAQHMSESCVEMTPEMYLFYETAGLTVDLVQSPWFYLSVTGHQEGLFHTAGGRAAKFYVATFL